MIVRDLITYLVCCSFVLSMASPMCIEHNVAGANYALHSEVIGAGGTSMQGPSGWRLDGTIGQVDARGQNDDAQVRLDGGFWSTATTALSNDRIFANGFDSSVTIEGSH